MPSRSLPIDDTRSVIRSLNARAGALESWSRTADRTARTAAARQAFREKFERQVDPEGILAPADRARRAEQARKAYYARLAAASVAARTGRNTSERSRSRGDAA